MRVFAMKKPKRIKNRASPLLNLFIKHARVFCIRRLMKGYFLSEKSAAFRHAFQKKVETAFK
jgi:hypothetical protein